METMREGPTAGLDSRLERMGETFDVAGNEPLPLAPSGKVWLVLEGTVEVFAVPREEPGKRTHLATLSAGAVLFGLGDLGGRSVPFGVVSKAPDPRLGLVAVGLPGTRVVGLQTSDLRNMIRDPACSEEIARRIDDWLESLFSLYLHEAPPQHFTPLVAGRETTLDEGEVGRGEDGLVWVRNVSGTTCYVGMEGLPRSPDAFLVPVTTTTWITAAEPARLSCVSTPMLLSGGGLWESLDRFHRLFLRFVELRLEATREEERERLGLRLDLDRQSLAAASTRLASVLGHMPGPPVTVGEPSLHLWAACRRVAEAQDLTLRKPPDLDPEAKPSHLLGRICLASRLRHRRVILRGDWWRRDNGPLLGFRLEEDSKTLHPVALLPTSPRSYDLWDPSTGARQPVSEELAESLHGEAFMLYPPLPERRVTKWDLLKLALRDRRHDFLTLLAVGVAGGLLSLLVPIITGKLFGQVIPDSDQVQLYQMVVALLLAAFAGAAFQITRGIAVLRVGGKIDGSVQSAVWDRLLRLPVSFFRRFTVGDLASRSLGFDRIRELMTGNVTTSVLAAVFSIFSFALLFYYSWRLALVATGLVVLLALVTLLLSFLQLRHQRALLRLQGLISSLLFGLIYGLSKLRISGAERRAYALWADRFAEQRELTVKARQAANLQTVFNTMYGVISLLTLFAVVGMASRIDMPVSEFLAFNAAFGQFQAAALSTIGVFSNLLTIVPVYERLRPILETLPEVDETKAETPELNGDLEVSHVSFRYKPDGPLILDDVSFRARPGDFVALVGPSGSGKSTCLRLILGFDQPESGSIYFDGQDLPSLDVHSVRRQIGVVLQGGRPIAGDIFTNIVGSSGLTLEDAWKAAAMAGLAEDIQAMPMGMHTVISEGAGTFSGGQKQRLLIARAIVHRPRILLFDEATSALDNRTQEVVGRSLNRLKATRIVVAHRLSTIREADRIYVLDKGRVVEQGTYEELLGQAGLFARLAERQML